MIPPRPSGFTLFELMVVVLLVGVLASLAAPLVRDLTSRTRARAALNHLAADLARARAIATSRAVRLHVSFRPARGCASSYVIARADGGVLLDSVSLVRRAPGVCLTSNVEQALTINSRGMIVGSARTVRARIGAHTDSLTVSIAGRVYRWY